MTAGKMDQMITLQRQSRIPNGAGSWTVLWTDVVSIWAAVVAKAGREGMDEGRTNATFINLFKIWNSGDAATVREADRIVWNGETWNIRNVRREGERNLVLVLEAERGVAS